MGHTISNVSVTFTCDDCGSEQTLEYMDVSDIDDTDDIECEGDCQCSCGCLCPDCACEDSECSECGCGEDEEDQGDD